ncbi:MAG: hypothetical protein IJX94_01455 [Clostridia bacterium]|nr:hypothetical protein [Clostridia bacterium]
MYNILIWKDHCVEPGNTYIAKNNADGTVTLTPTGKILQQGTNQSATNFNNMEAGILDAHLANSLLLLALRDLSSRLEAAEKAIATLQST